MYDDEDRGKLNIEKYKILAILPNNQELQGDISTVKIYSSDVDGIDWLYSGLEGFLALVVDYSIKTKYICLYDPTNYQKVFQYELYKGFEKFFEPLAPDFRSFEIETGFIGLQFEKIEEAMNFEMTLKKISSMKNLFSKAVLKEDQKELKNKKELAMNYAKKLKENLGEKDSKYDENYAEDGTQICKHKNFKVLNNISYDKKLKKFKFGKISDELKEMFVSFGIKKKDLESDMDFAFTLFKRVIVVLGSENKLKNTSLDSIVHTFLPPDEREKLRRQEELAEAKLNAKRNDQIKKKQQQAPKIQAKVYQNRRPPAAKSGSVPLAPPPPPPPPPPPSVPTAVPKPRMSAVITAKPPPSAPVLDKQTLLQNVKLTKVVKKEENKEKNIAGNNKNFLQNALSIAIQNRRNNLHMHDDENNDDEDDDDWDP